MTDDMIAEADRIDSYFREKRSRAYMALGFLQFLVHRKAEGQFASPGQPHTDTQLAWQFYVGWHNGRHAGKKKPPANYDIIGDAANKLRGQVRDLLSEYYKLVPEAHFRLEIVDEKDRFEPYLKTRHPLLRTENAGAQFGDGISVSLVWKADRVHELLRTVTPGSEIRFLITGFVDVRVMRPTLRRALERGVHVRILQTDPDGPLIKARFRLRPELTVAEFRHEMRQQQRVLKALAAEATNGSLELRACDLMPFGHFIQGVSTEVGPWIIIGLLPPLAPYSAGPMIELRPTAADLWELFDTNWAECWKRPLGSDRLDE